MSSQAALFAGSSCRAQAAPAVRAAKAARFQSFRSVKPISYRFKSLRTLRVSCMQPVLHHSGPLAMASKLLTAAGCRAAGSRRGGQRGGNGHH